MENGLKEGTLSLELGKNGLLMICNLCVTIREPFPHSPAPNYSPQCSRIRTSKLPERINSKNTVRHMVMRWIVVLRTGECETPVGSSSQFETNNGVVVDINSRGYPTLGLGRAP